MIKQKELALFNEGLYYTGIETILNEQHGNFVKLIQSFPSPLLGHETQSVLIKEEDIDRVIEFLQLVKSI